MMLCLFALPSTVARENICFTSHNKGELNCRETPALNALLNVYDSGKSPQRTRTLFFNKQYKICEDRHCRKCLASDAERWLPCDKTTPFIVHLDGNAAQSRIRAVAFAFFLLAVPVGTLVLALRRNNPQSAESQSAEPQAKLNLAEHLGPLLDFAASWWLRPIVVHLGNSAHTIYVRTRKGSMAVTGTHGARIESSQETYHTISRVRQVVPVSPRFCHWRKHVHPRLHSGDSHPLSHCCARSARALGFNGNSQCARCGCWDRDHALSHSRTRRSACILAGSVSERACEPCMAEGDGLYGTRLPTQIRGTLGLVDTGYTASIVRERRRQHASRLIFVCFPPPSNRICLRAGMHDATVIEATALW